MTKQCTLDVISKVKSNLPFGASIVFVSGNFNVIHPGHLRLLNFAADCGDFLVVGVNSDDYENTFIQEDLRLEGIKAIGVVDFGFILDDPIEEVLKLLRPKFVVKGREYEGRNNEESTIVESYGGKVIFSSGEVVFSSLDLLKREYLGDQKRFHLKPSLDFLSRHKIVDDDLRERISSFKNMQVLVLGDLIVDEYITCDALGMSQEDPTVVVTPIQNDLFLGGAGIVASHAAALGAKVLYFGVSGIDRASKFATQKLREYGVDPVILVDESRPTTLKQRFRARGKTLLRVNHLKQHTISKDLECKLLDSVRSKLHHVDLLIFSDFNYGCLPQSLVDEISICCKKNNVPMVADSQSSSQIGDISRFRDMLLITPTEHEARLAIQNTLSGLAVIANELQEKSAAQNVFITLGSEGVMIQAPKFPETELHTDLLPALNNSPLDVSGAGDCMLTAAAMSLVAGATIWESAYIGSVAASCQVARLGNYPLAIDELTQALVL
jgi:rfaE bifunctional protein kinase chain/domain